MTLSGTSAAVFLLWAGAAVAQPAPASPGVRPHGEPASQTSVPKAAPPAGTSQTTGSAAQDPSVKEMNSSEKAKIDAKGK